MFERNAKLINKKFYQYLIPSVLTIFAMQIASLFDGIIVGNFLGNDALSATSLVMPILYIVQTPGLALGVGGAIVVGILLGIAFHPWSFVCPGRNPFHNNPPIMLPHFHLSQDILQNDIYLLDNHLLIFDLECPLNAI